MSKEESIIKLSLQTTLSKFSGHVYKIEGAGLWYYTKIKPNIIIILSGKREMGINPKDYFDGMGRDQG
jgi:hypothetical protein